MAVWTYGNICPSCVFGVCLEGIWALPVPSFNSFQKHGNGKDRFFILCAWLGHENCLKRVICPLISPLCARPPCDTGLRNSPAQNFCFFRFYFVPEVPFVSPGCRAGSRCRILNTEALVDLQLREREQGKWAEILKLFLLPGLSLVSKSGFLCQNTHFKVFLGL